MGVVMRSTKGCGCSVTYEEGASPLLQQEAENSAHQLSCNRETSYPLTCGSPGQWRPGG